jgi:hypothetical protein
MYLCVALCLGLVLSRCNGAPSTTPSSAVNAGSLEPTVDPQSATVFIDLYSGRADAPTWKLSATETRTLTEMLDALSPSDTAVEPPGRLGYRSFFVNLPDRSITVYGGIVRQKQEDRFRYFIDADQQVERWLYATSKPHIDPDLYQQLDTMITEGAQR